jgi:dTDP-glucose 4,6-dehydratase
VNILITGGAGFIGSHFADFCLGVENVKKIRILDKLTYAGSLKNLQQALLDPRTEFVHGDICDARMTNMAMQEIDIVFNFAAESHVDRSISDSTEFINTNVLGTQVLLETALKTSVKRFVQISTDEVYGSVVNGESFEEDQLLPNSPYSASKASADLLVRSYNRTFGLDTIITRCSNNYGSRQFPEKIIPLFILNLMNQKKIPVYGDGTNVRDWLNVRDHCNGIWIAATKGESGEIYNIGGGKELSNIALIDILLNSLNKTKDSIEYVPDRLGHDFRYSVNYDKLSKLGYSPQIEFLEGIDQTINWYKNYGTEVLNK